MSWFYCNHTDFFAFPVNIGIGLCFMIGIYILHRYYLHTRFVKGLTSMPATLIVLSLLIILLVFEGIWALQLFRSWIFILLQFLLLLILGLVICQKFYGFSSRRLFFLFNHGGLWLALFAALLGAPDREEYKMIAPLYRPEYNAIDANGNLYPLPFTVELNQFELEYYSHAPRSPKRFCSTVTLQSRDRQEQVQVEVNQPAHFKGYTLYQDSYDLAQGARSSYSVLLVVKDPWISLVYAGIGMLLAGAIGLILSGPVQKLKI